MKPVNLVLFDLDNTLYQSPHSDEPDWYFHAHSLGEPGPPGFDHRWNLPFVLEARRVIRRPENLTIVLTGRPQHGQMRAMILKMLSMAEIQPQLVQLKPIDFTESTAVYKGMFTRQILDRYPSINKVVFYDDKPSNHVTVRAATQFKGKTFCGFGCLPHHVG